MTRPQRQGRRFYRRSLPLAAALGLIGLAVGGYGGGRQLARMMQAPPSAAPALKGRAAPAPAPEPAGASKGPAGKISRETIIEAQRKRVLGRLKSYEHIARVAETMRPLVDRAVRQRAVAGDIQYLARREGKAEELFRREFAAMQEADLLLESGGDPEARSVADAVGVAQFLAGTARMAGLRVDERAARSLGYEIAAVDRKLAEIASRPAGWSKEPPAELQPQILRSVQARGGASGAEESSVIPSEEEPGPATAAPEPVTWNRDQWLDYYRSVRKRLVAQRRNADQRLDPAAAIAAQTRHLVELTRSLGGIDWALQGYHGGYGGARKALALFHSEIPPRYRLAARGGAGVLGGSASVSYDDFYMRLHPQSTPQAFNYVYGRSDDHRNYWWKVLMAHRALDLYRESPARLRAEWKKLHPGYYADAVLLGLPRIPELQFRSEADLAAAFSRGSLVRLPAAAASIGLVTGSLAPLQPTSAAAHKGLRPAAMGALLRTAEIYRTSGGRGPLVIARMVESQSYVRLHKSRYPPAPLPPGIPRDPDYHATGYAFDIARPASDWDRKVLEFALGQLSDALLISWRPESGPHGRSYHVAADPDHTETLMTAFRRYAQQTGAVHRPAGR